MVGPNFRIGAIVLVSGKFCISSAKTAGSRSDQITRKGFCGNMIAKYARKIVLLCVVALLVFVAGCGGGTKSSGGNTSTDTNAQTNAGSGSGTASGGNGGGSSSAPAKLVVSSFGGAYEETQKELAKQFAQEYNVEIEFVTLYSADALAKIRAEKGNPSIDVVQFSGGQESIAGKEDLIVPIDLNELSNGKDLYDAAKDPNGYAPAYAFSALGIIYNEEKISTPPTSWKDLWKDEYKGKVALVDISNSFGLQFLLAVAKMNGGGEHDIQPGLDAIRELLPNAAAVVKSTPEVGTLFAQEEAIIAAYDTGYAFTFRQQGQPIKFVTPQEGAIGTFINAQVVKGGNEELAKKFVDFLLRPGIQKQFAEKNGYAPTNRTVELSEELQAVMPYGEEAVGRLIRLNNDLVNENKAAWTEEWNKLISQ